ncbi:MAG: hypothetical protein QM756_16420 [Polyangiaceae bacterium]
MTVETAGLVEYRLSHRFTLVPADQKAQLEAEVHITRLRKTIAERGHPEGLRLWIFPSDDDATRVSGQTTYAEIHNATMRLVAETMAADNITVTLVTVRADAFFAWLGDRPNTHRRPIEFITRDWSDE